MFGALISPTDPVAVLATLKRGELSPALRVVLQGEALFNDGVGIVVFTALVAYASGAAPSPAQALFQVVLQAAGGLALGRWRLAGHRRHARRSTITSWRSACRWRWPWASTRRRRRSASRGPIAAVSAGLLMGATAATRHEPRPRAAPDHLLDPDRRAAERHPVLPARPVAAGGAAEPRGIAVWRDRDRAGAGWRGCRGAALGRLLPPAHEERGASAILVWGGLHGALSLALALSLPPGPERPLILAITFVVAAFSVAVQGLSFAPLAHRVSRPRDGRPATG